MRRIHAELQPRAAAFDRHGVGPLGGMLLLTVGEGGSVSIQAIVDALGRDKSQVSRLIGSLEKKGLLLRRRCPNDARVSLLVLTPAGEEQLGLIRDVLDSVVEELFAPLSSEDRLVFNGLLQRVLQDNEP